MSNIDKDVNVAEDKPRDEYGDLPWMSGKLAYVSDAHYNRIAECVGKHPVEMARKITKAVNLHDELVKDLEEYVGLLFIGSERGDPEYAAMLSLLEKAK